MPFFEEIIAKYLGDSDEETLYKVRNLLIIFLTNFSSFPWPNSKKLEEVEFYLIRVRNQMGSVMSSSRGRLLSSGTPNTSTRMILKFQVGLIFQTLKVVKKNLPSNQECNILLQGLDPIPFLNLPFLHRMVTALKELLED